MASHSDVLELGPGEGRHYALGRMQAVFKADQDESGERYAISEWWLEPHCTGAGAHLHEANEEIFYVLEGTAWFLVGNEWRSLSKGSFLRIPAGVMHDFENRSDRRDRFQAETGEPDPASFRFHQGKCPAGRRRAVCVSPSPM